MMVRFKFHNNALPLITLALLISAAGCKKKEHASTESTGTTAYSPAPDTTSHPVTPMPPQGQIQRGPGAPVGPNPEAPHNGKVTALHNYNIETIRAGHLVFFFFMDAQKRTLKNTKAKGVFEIETPKGIKTVKLRTEGEDHYVLELANPEMPVKGKAVFKYKGNTYQAPFEDAGGPPMGPPPNFGSATSPE